MKRPQTNFCSVLIALNLLYSWTFANSNLKDGLNNEDDPFIDLESMPQEFVLATKKIEIPGFPNAFNPSILKWGDFILMSFRIIPNPKQSFTSLLGVIWLNEDFDPISKPQILNTRSIDSPIPSRAEDGRLIAVGERIYFVYSDNREPKITRGGFRLFCAELDFDGKEFTLQNIDCLSHFEDESKNVREKNWVPFDDNGRLLLAYSLNPHRIFHPLLRTSTCETIATTKGSIHWSWGELRGGTPGLLENGQYLAFFHSSKNMASLQSEGKALLHYFMGAYMFSSKFPFAITQISPRPIVGQGFYEKTNYKPYWKPVKSLFPGGFISDENVIWLAYGKDDYEIWVAKIDKTELFKSLIPVRTQ